MMGLEFLLVNSENIKRQNDTNVKIYTAKSIKGKWIQGRPKAPYGYNIEGAEENRRLAVNEEQAYIIKMIYESCLPGVPNYKILEAVKKLGFNRSGNSAIDNILSNPVYYDFQYVK